MQYLHTVQANKAAKRVRINGVQPDANALPSDQNENRRQLNSNYA